MKITKEDEITGVSITTLHDVTHVESHRVIVTTHMSHLITSILKCHTSVIHAIFPMIHAAT